MTGEEYEQHNPLWRDNLLQFSRLLAELMAVGVSAYQHAALRNSMDLSKADLDDLFDRAQQQWELSKRGVALQRYDCKSAAELRSKGDILTPPYVLTPGDDVSRLELNPRAENRLLSAGINTIGDLLLLGRKGVMAIDGVGKTFYQQIRDRLLQSDFVLSENEWPDRSRRRKVKNGG